MLFWKYQDMFELWKQSVMLTEVFNSIGNISQGICHFRWPHRKVSLHLTVLDVFNKFNDNNQISFLINIMKSVQGFLYNTAGKFSWIAFWFHLVTFFLKSLLCKLLIFTFYYKQNGSGGGASEWIIVILVFQPCCFKTSVVNFVHLLWRFKFNLKFMSGSTS